MVRRVVTGHDQSGRSVIVSDGTLDAIAPWHAWEFHRVWGSDDTLSFPDDGTEPAYSSYFPGVGGFRCWLFLGGVPGGSQLDGRG
jgi:hypothetical protein